MGLSERSALVGKGRTAACGPLFTAVIAVAVAAPLVVALTIFVSDLSV
jgi:hypothetical protein